jgi:hypothetical protein
MVVDKRPFTRAPATGKLGVTGDLKKRLSRPSANPSAEHIRSAVHEKGNPMSPPFTVAAVGLVLALAALVIGELLHAKGAVPLAFLVGGTMMVGGVVVGLMRSLRGR